MHLHFFIKFLITLTVSTIGELNYHELFFIAHCTFSRFYSALYRKLFDAKITKSTHQAMLLNLIYKALLRDNEMNRTKVFVKRLLQVNILQLKFNFNS